MFLILPLRPDASWHRPPIGTVATMVLLLVIHVVWGRSGPEALQPYLLDFQAFDPVQWLTSGLLHADWMHLIGNLVFLYVFGAIVEDYLGHWLVPVFLLLVITSGALEQSITLLNQDQGFALGASSAIYGLMAMATLWSPRTHISTFILVLWRPFWVNIRVVWMAGCYMTLQVLTVWLQGGEPSSEFLHACGMVVGLVLGVLCLRRRWVDAQGDDLFGLQKPPTSGGTTRVAAAVTAPIVPWETQMGRLETALAGSQHRVALAAYEVLRREHPDRLPPMWMLERLMYLCEDAIDFHRCVAIAERAIAMGPVSDLLRFSYARVAGLHLGDVELGLAQLEQIDRTTLPDEALAEVDQLQAKLERRRRPTVAIRATRAPVALLALLCLLSGRVDAVDEAGVLPPFEFAPVTMVDLGTGAKFQVPKDLVYLPWEAVERFLIVAPGNPAHHQPTGMLIRAERFDALADERERVTSRTQWESRSAEVFVLDTPIMVGWVEGWIDTSQPLPEPAQLLDYLQTQSHVINNRRLLGPMTLSYHDWGQKPLFDAGKGRLNWSLHVTLTPDAALGGGLYHFESMHHIHLGAKGVLFFVAELIAGLPPAPPNGLPIQPGQPALPELLGKVSAGVSWDSRTGFTTTRPDGVGERVGGLRAIIQPRLLFGGDKDELDFHRGLGFAWILILLPVALVGFGLYRWLTGVMRAATPAKSPLPASPDRCPACGGQTTPGAPRCFSCGTSLLRR